MEIKSWITGKVIYTGEAETLSYLVATAIKSGADLGGADLRGANLYGANLYGADLRGANLGQQHLIGFSGIGSAKRATLYWLEADKVWCGCFEGTLKQFSKKVEENHANNPRHLAEYRAGLAFLNTAISLIPEAEREIGATEYKDMPTESKAIRDEIVAQMKKAAP